MASVKGILIYSIVAFIAYLAYQKFYLKQSQVSPNVPIVQSPAGQINGALMTTVQGRSISAYRSIPYAQPPVGNLRFQKPQLLLENAWQGLRDGSIKIGSCVQPNRAFAWLKAFRGSEDCLYLNIYVPQTVSSKNGAGLPVMAWIHGGGFNSGDASDTFYGPGFLLDQDVILVTINYRLGLFGFLTGGSTDMPGNLGLWDQLGAFQWIQKNIESFGGDPKQVTIFGESAGGWSISYHLASEKTQGQYKAAIVQSGPLDMTLLNADKHTSLIDLHQQYIEKTGCWIKGDPKRTLDCMNGKSVDELLRHYYMHDECNLFGRIMPFPLIWMPYDDSRTLQDSFFKDHPRKIFEKGQFNKVPVMIGNAKDEGYLQAGFFHKDPSLFQKFWKDPKCPASAFLGHYSFGKEVPTDILEKIEVIKDEYFDGNTQSFDSQVLKALANAYSDSGFNLGTDLLAKQLSQKTTTFYYQFDHLGSFSFADIVASPYGVLWELLKRKFGFFGTLGLGVCHADELFHLFQGPDVSFLDPSDQRDVKMSEFMVKLWTNFVRFQDPTPDTKAWPAYTSSSWRGGGNSYVRLENSTILAQRDNIRDARLAFWQKLLK